MNINCGGKHCFTSFCCVSEDFAFIMLLLNDYYFSWFRTTQHGGQWRRQPSAAANVQFRDDYDNFVRAIGQATAQDVKTANRMAEDGAHIAMLDKSKAELAAMMPAASAASANVGLKENRALGALVQQLGEMILGRKSTIADAGELISAVLLFSLYCMTEYSTNFNCIN